MAITNEEKQKMIEALSGLRAAFNNVQAAWSEGMVDLTMGTEKYPFEYSFDELTYDMGEWVESFQKELTDHTGYWIDLRHPNDTYWIYAEGIEGKIINMLGLTEYHGSPDALTPITFEQYKAIQEIWIDTRYEHDPKWRDRSRVDAIEAIMQEAASSGEEAHEMREYYGN